MDLLKQTKDLCKLYGVVPTKSLGQNFLVDENILNNIIKEALVLKTTFGSKKNFNVLEIGGGFGFLTTKLINVADKVFVIEKDRKLYDGLKKIEDVSGNKLKVFLGDALKSEEYRELIENYFNNEDYFIVANIPYSITSFLIRTLLEFKYSPLSMILMMQKEVGDRICAKPGDMSILSFSCQIYANVYQIFNVSNKSFFPEPEVNSVVVRFDKNKEYLQKLTSESVLKNIFKFVNVGFSNKRKMLYHNIFSSYRLDKNFVKKSLLENGINENARAQELSVNDWINLWYTIFKI